MTRLDILIPVYHEGRNLLKILRHLEESVRTPFRALICYDEENDPTLEALKEWKSAKFEVLTVKNRGRGVHGAIMTGFKAVEAPAVLVYPADDDVNAVIVDDLVKAFESGAEIAAPSRFVRGGCMVGCRWTKAALVRTAAFLLYHLAGLPTHDPTNGFRLFSKKVIESIPVESSDGFAFSIELLVKAHRRGLKISEVPSRWFERKQGKSRFKILKWMPIYLRWFGYAFATRLGVRTKTGSESV